MNIVEKFEQWCIVETARAFAAQLRAEAFSEYYGDDDPDCIY